MHLVSDGWHNSSWCGIWDKDCLDKVSRIDTFVTGFPTISGIDEDGLGFRYDSVRVFKYFGADGKELSNETSSFSIPKKETIQRFFLLVVSFLLLCFF